MLEKNVHNWPSWSLFQFSLVSQFCLTLCNPMDCNMPGSPVHHQLLELAQTHILQFSDAIQLSHPLSSPSLPAFNLSQHQGLFQWVSSLHQVAKVLEFQLQHQSFQWTFRYILRESFHSKLKRQQEGEVEEVKLWIFLTAFSVVLCMNLCVSVCLVLYLVV